jgi:hypothetical protein
LMEAVELLLDELLSFLHPDEIMITLSMIIPICRCFFILSI